MHHDSDIDNDSPQHGSASFAKETMLELVEVQKGRLELREVNAEVDGGDALVSIEFSDKINEVLGGDAQQIGQHMIQAAIQVIMHKQMSQWHAHVYDEEPTYYS